MRGSSLFFLNSILIPLISSDIESKNVCKSLAVVIVLFVEYAATTLFLNSVIEGWSFPPVDDPLIRPNIVIFDPPEFESIIPLFFIFISKKVWFI